MMLGPTLVGAIGAGCIALSTASSAANGAEPPVIRALIITGHNNHNWPFTSHAHKETLEATGRFSVDITQTPEITLAAPGALNGYSVLVLDYNDGHSPKRWGAAAEKNFTDAVSSGTGVVAIHSANGAFKGWADYERMIALMWREGAGHGPVHEFNVVFTDREHPVLAGAGEGFGTRDELYHGLSNPQDAKYRLLAGALDSGERGSGKDEPIVFTSQFGSGRVFVTTLGHVWPGVHSTKSSVLNPGFRSLVARGAEWAATGSVSQGSEWADVRPHNSLSGAEKDQGWVLLFDGRSAEHFRGFRKAEMPAVGWAVREGLLVRTAGQGGGDIVTRDQYGDFEFVCDWRVSPGGNSGIIYRSTEDHNYCWETGPEMQILDDGTHPDSGRSKTKAGALYDLIGCSEDVSRPAGEWNSARVVARGTHIEHWLNGVKVVDIDTAGPDFKEEYRRSKWTGMPSFNTRPRGHIALQDHGDVVEFRNIKVRPLN